MNSKYLMIGNLVQDQNGNLLKVIELTTMLSDRADVGFYVVDRTKYPLTKGWKAEPIPLTEKWLLKLGFEKEYDSQFRKILTYYNEGLGFALTYTVHKKRNSTTLEWKGNNVSKVKYVHQLQNLYFALTRKELTIKEALPLNE